jgi:hypothetical protein
MRSVCYQKHRLIGRLDRAESERKIAIPALGKRDRMPARMASPYDRARTGNNQTRNHQALDPSAATHTLMAIRDAAVIFRHDDSCA